jgi:RND family efflux transporter MFP subunit
MTTLRLCALALCAVGSLGSCQRTQEAPAEEVRPVRSITVGAGAGTEILSLTGAVHAQSEVNYSFRIDGRLRQRPVKVGDELKPGQLVAELDPSNEESGVQSARAKRDAARARLIEQRNNHARQKGLLDKRFISSAAFDQVEAELKSAESALRSAQSDVTLAENRLSYTRLLTDAGGLVAGVSAEPGEVVAAGRTVVQVARKGGLDAVFDVPASLRDTAPNPDPEVIVTLTADPNVSAKGRVREIAPRADPQSGTFRVRIGLIDPPARLRLGSTVTGRVHVERVSEAEIPASALVRSGSATAVWVVDPKAGTVSLRPVDVGRYGSEQVTITAGLDSGEVVVTAGVQALHPGQKVRLLGTAK